MFVKPVGYDEARPKWLLNGLPKSGLHLIALMVAPLADPPTGKPWYRPDWWGDMHNVWSSRFKTPTEMRGQYLSLASLQPGQYLRSHAAYREDVYNFTDLCGVSHVFIYRDPRDVAISQLHHVLSPAPQLQHTCKPFYMLMADRDKALMAIIEGAGSLSGVMERWEQFAPWLDCERVHCVKFEDAIADREKVARDILSYGVNRINDALTLNWRLDPHLFDDAVQEMVKTSKRTEMSTTFRKGKSGQWRDEFKPEHVKAFKATDNGWLVKLGYEANEDWGL